MKKTECGEPILDAEDPKVRHLALMMADVLEAMVVLDKDSIIATDVLFMMMRDNLWARDNHSGVNNPKITPEESQERLQRARNQVMDPKRYADYMSRYVAQINSVCRPKGNK